VKKTRYVTSQPPSESYGINWYDSNFCTNKQWKAGIPLRRLVNNTKLLTYIIPRTIIKLSRIIGQILAVEWRGTSL